MTIAHTPECQGYNDASKAAIAAYFADWPDHCKRCGGWGGFHSTCDPSPAGVTLGHGTMEDFDTCPDCTEKGLCTRCMVGRLIFVDDPAGGETGLCRICGATDLTPGCPEPPECYCWTMEEP